MPYSVERLLEVHENVVEVLLVLKVLLAQYPMVKDLGPVSRSRVTLREITRSTGRS